MLNVTSIMLPDGAPEMPIRPGLEPLGNGRKQDKKRLTVLNRDKVGLDWAPLLTGEKTSQANYPITIRCIDSGRFAATLATTFPFSRLTSAARRRPPKITASTPKVAAISMIVSAGESLML